MRLKSIALNFRVWSAASSVLFQPIVQSSVQLRIAPQLIRDVRVFDGENVIEHRSVLIEDGKISQIGGPTLEIPNADVIDGQGRTLLPGLIDAHVHIPDHAEEASRQALELGVTTQLDMFTNGEKLKKIKRLETGPDYEFCPCITPIISDGSFNCARCQQTDHRQGAAIRHYCLWTIREYRVRSNIGKQVARAAKQWLSPVDLSRYFLLE